MSKIICPNCNAEIKNLATFKPRDRHYAIFSGLKIRKSKKIVVCENCQEKLFWNGFELKM